MLSPAVVSPLVPSSKNGCVIWPPISLRLPLTVIPVLGGVVAGITVTVKWTFAPGETVVGFAASAANSVVPPPLHVTGVVAAFRGAEGVLVEKSVELLSESWQPFCARILLELFGGAVVLVPSKKMFVALPHPTASMIVPVFMSPLRMARPPAVALIEHRQVVGL